MHIYVKLNHKNLPLGMCLGAGKKPMFLLNLNARVFPGSFKHYTRAPALSPLYSMVGLIGGALVAQSVAWWTMVIRGVLVAQSVA